MASTAIGNTSRPGSARALPAVLLTVLLWASAYPAIALALTGFDPFGLASIRYLIASLALLLIARIAALELPSWADVPRIVLAGALGISAYNLLLNFGQTLVNAGTAGLLINVSPVFAAILGAMVLGDRLRPAGWVGIAISFAGAILIAFGRSDRDMRFDPGALYILGAALCFALQWVIQKPLLGRHRPLAVATWVLWAGSMLLLPLLPRAFERLPDAPADALAATIYLGLGPAALAYAAWAYALTRYSVTRATSFLYLVPPVTLLLAYLLLGEIAAPLTLIGGALALAGVIVVNTLGREVRGR